MQTWSNPEFWRHRRSELRRGRAITMVAVALLVCGLIALGHWASVQVGIEAARRSAEQFGGSWQNTLARMQRDAIKETAAATFRTLFVIQALVLTLWSLFACSQSVSGERERKTWDFQRTTCLTPGEIVLGKLFGEPLMVYFITLCVLPVAVVAGVVGKIPLREMAALYALVVGAALFLGICGIALSMLLEARGRGIGSLAALTLYGLLAMTSNFQESSFPGFAAISPMPGLHALLDSHPWQRPATLFGHAVPWVWMSLMLWATVGGWITVVLLRNLKKDYVEMRPLSRGQAVGCVAFLNFLLYAFFNPAAINTRWDSRSLAELVVAANALFLFVMGVATLTPVERLRVWWRERANGQANPFSESGLAWPWLVASGVVAYGLLVWGLLAWKNSLDYDAATLALAAVQLLAVVVFVVRDMLFLQWCALTNLKVPLFKGVLFLGLYYGSSAVLIGLCAAHSSSAQQFAEGLLTPFGAFDANLGRWHIPGGVLAGIALQTGLIGVIFVGISQRIQRIGALVAAGAD